MDNICDMLCSCIKVLPTVYSDSLSYYEAIGKLAECVKQVAAAEQTNTGEIKKLSASLEESIAQYNTDKQNYVTKKGTPYRLYGTDANGDFIERPFSSNVSNGDIAQYSQNGNLRTAEPTQDADAVNLAYFNAHGSTGGGDHYKKLYIAGNMSGWGSGFAIDVNEVLIPDLAYYGKECYYDVVIPYPENYTGADCSCIYLFAKLHCTASGNMTVTSMTGFTSFYPSIYGSEDAIQFGTVSSLQRYADKDALKAQRNEHEVLASWAGYAIV